VTTLLAVHELSKKFGNLVAVDQVGFEVEEGAIYGIAGPNGAGKTSLFNAITGIPFGPDSGTITFGDRLIGRMPAHEICRIGIARTFQQVTAFESLSVEQNVRLGAAFGRVGGGADRTELIARILDQAGLTRLRGLRAGRLPLAQRKRLMIATALATEPRLLMLDEPAAGLHGPELTDLDRLIRTIRDSGVTILLIEHVLPVLFRLSDTLMIMDSGRRLVEGPPATVAVDQRVIDAYLGREGREATDAPAG
jgi:branched-chain amino acid transport system ATP-binding protein